MSDSQEKNLDYEAEGGSVVDVHDAVRREKILPPTGREPISFGPLILTCLILLLGAGYLGAYGNFFSDDVYTTDYYRPDPRPPGKGGPEAESDLPWIDKWLAGGKKVYANCAACHQPNGGGQPGLFPPLTGSEWVNGGTTRLGAIVLKGVGGPFTVAGQTYNQQMAPWNGLSDEALAQVLTYVRIEFGGMGGEPGAVVTPEMIKAAREEFAGQTEIWTEAGLLAIPADAMLPGTEIDLQTGEPLGSGEAAPEAQPGVE